MENEESQGSGGGGGAGAIRAAAAAAPPPARAAAMVAGALGGMGLLASPVLLGAAVILVIIIGGLAVLLWPLVLLILLFHGGAGHNIGNDAAKSIAVLQGDGRGPLDHRQVPSWLTDGIDKAGQTCEQIGPIVLAAQIEVESNFNAAQIGPHGEQGLAQLPPDVFTRLGQDDDGDGDTSPFDPADNVNAQARYLCELYPAVRGLIDGGQAQGDPLDLTLVAYKVGLDAVRDAHGIPNTNEAQGYVVQIRALFAKYQGIGAAPTSFPPAPDPAPSSTN